MTLQEIAAKCLQSPPREIYAEQTSRGAKVVVAFSTPLHRIYTVPVSAGSREKSWEAAQRIAEQLTDPISCLALATGKFR